MSWKTLTLTGLLWADETLLVLSHCVHANLLLPAALLFLGAAAAAAADLRTLELALALHTVPHAVAKVDQEA